MNDTENIITFEYNPSAFVRERKTVVRHLWVTEIYKSWMAGDKFFAWDPNAGEAGVKLGEGKVRAVRREDMDLLIRDEKYGEKEAHMEGFNVLPDPLSALVDALKETGMSEDDRIARVHFRIEDSISPSEYRRLKSE
jgi:hypothetical protein